MELELKIERIQNGFIVTEEGKRFYYDSLKRMIDFKIGEAMIELIRNFDAPDAVCKEAQLKFSLKSI